MLLQNCVNCFQTRRVPTGNQMQCNFCNEQVSFERDANVVQKPIFAPIVWHILDSQIDPC